MLRPAGLEVALELRAPRADLVRALERLHPLRRGSARGQPRRAWRASSSLAAWAASLHRMHEAGKANGANSARPQLEVERHARRLDGNCATFAGVLRRDIAAIAQRSRRCLRASLRARAAIAGARPAGRGSAPCRRRRESAPASQQIASVTAATARRPCRRSAARRARATSRDLRERDRAHGRARRRRRCRRRATARPGRRGCIAMPRSVLISDTASAPCASAAAATVGRRRAVRASASRSAAWRCSGRTASSSAGDLARVGAHEQPGLDVRARDVELERGDLVARRRRPRRACATSSRREAHHVDDQRHGQLGELRAGPGEVALEPLVRAARSS